MFVGVSGSYCRIIAVKVESKSEEVYAYRRV